MIRSNHYLWWMPVVLLVLFFGGAKTRMTCRGSIWPSLKKDPSSTSIKLELGAKRAGVLGHERGTGFFQMGNSRTRSSGSTLNPEELSSAESWDRGPSKSNCRGQAYSLSEKFKKRPFKIGSKILTPPLSSLAIY